MTTTSSTPIVVDEGSAQIKVCWHDGKVIRQLKIPSLVSRDSMDAVDGSGNFLPSSYQIGDRELYTKPTMSHPQPTKNADYQTSLNNRVLVHEALRQAGFGGKEVHVYCTLPVTQFFQGNRVNQALIEEKKKRLMGEISNMASAPLARITRVNVSPESIPAWYHLLINEEGEVDQNLVAAQSVMVVDIGGTTTDITLMDGNSQPRNAISLDIGVFDVSKNLCELIVQENISRTVPAIHMDTILRQKRYRNTDVSDLLRKASLPVRDFILDKMKEFEIDPGALDHIVYVGGGAALFGAELAAEYGNLAASHTPEQPDMAVALGLLKSELVESQAEPA